MVHQTTRGRWIVEAIKLTGGDVENKEQFLAAMRKVVITDAPRGPIKVDDFGNPIQNTYSGRLKKCVENARTP